MYGLDMTTIEIHPKNLTALDADLSRRRQGLLYVVHAQYGDIPCPVDEAGDPLMVSESEMVNLDYFSPEDFEAWEQHRAEIAAEDRAVWEYLDRMADEEDHRNTYWD